MALSINIEGKGVIANCNALSDSAGGAWSEQGGGTMSVSTDVFLIGSACIGGKYAGKSGLQQYDLGSGNELDFTASTGNEAGQLLYIWISNSALGTLDTLSTYPLTIRFSSDSPGTSNYIDYLIAGSDDKNGWSGGFKCFIVDPTKTPSRVSGTQSSIIASVRTIGVWIDCSGSARADSLFIDQLSVGKGLRVTGTSTTGWKDIVDYCTDYSTRGWGMFQKREGIYYSYGQTYIGDSVNQSSAVSFTDSGRTIQYGVSEYCTNAATGTWASSVPTNFSGIIIEDHSSHTTTFADGVIVGTDNGRSGTSFIGNSSMNVSVDLYGGNNSGSVTTLYGTGIKNCTGAINSGNDADHKFLGVSFGGCSQFDPVGAPVIRNCTFAETTDVDSAVKWNSSIDMQKCSFIANTTGAAVEHSTQGTFGYTDLLFSGNTYDILYSDAVSSGVLTINATDSNPSTYEITNPTGNSVSIVNSVNLNVYVKDTNNNAVEGASVAIYKTSDDTELMNELSAVSTGLAQEAFNYVGDTPVYIRVRKSSTGTRYIPIKTTATIENIGLTLTVVLNEDINI